jgi:hypothetical protein
VPGEGHGVVRAPAALEPALGLVSVRKCGGGVCRVS